MESKYSILEGIPEKDRGSKDTTSLKWKKDVIDFFNEKKLKSCLEIGTCCGMTTKILSYLFKDVHTIEFNPGRLNKAKQICYGKDNITYHLADAYSNETYKNIPNHFDVVVIDCMHLYPHVMADINRALTLFNEERGMYLVFDDYGHPESIGVKQAVDQAISEGLKLEKKIGEDPGFTVHRDDEGSKFTLIYKEGIILSYGI